MNVTLTLEQLTRDQVLSPMHVAFAETVCRLAKDHEPANALAFALTSEQLSRGHVCLDLSTASQIGFPLPGSPELHRTYDDWPSVDAWLRGLRESPSVSCREPGDAGDGLTRPLVLDANSERLYLARYWYYQQQMAADLLRRLSLPTFPVDETRLRDDVARLFPERTEPGGRDQCIAAANAVDRRFAVITGGPGTGKTTAVAKLIALRMLQQPSSTEDQLRVLLMAPTGKAAQRLNESLGRAAGKLDVPPTIRSQLAEVKAGTIHRILGWTPIPPERGGPFTHSDLNPLEADLVLVDESSMVDMGLMWHLLRAVPPETQLILIGDRDQLASVEAGGVLGDLCGEDTPETPEPLGIERRKLVASRTGLEFSGTATSRDRVADCVSHLQFSHRFDSESQLGQLAASIRGGDVDAALRQLHDADPHQISWTRLDATGSQFSEFIRSASRHFEAYLRDLHDAPQGRLSTLEKLSEFRILCAHREGRWGEERINAAVAQQLGAEGLLEPTPGPYFGQSIMVTRNNYRQQLFNGDVGVVANSPAGTGLAVVFEDPSVEAGCRSIPASLVGNMKPCYAMTIHKSQGSEFHQVMVVLPEYNSPILTRELLYTAITRVSDLQDPDSGERIRGRLHLLASESVLRSTIQQRIRRTSGLRSALNAGE